MSKSSVLTCASRRLATVVCIDLNFDIFASICSAISETSSYQGCTISKYSSSWTCNFSRSPWSFLFLPMFNIHCNAGRSFIATTTASSSCWVFWTSLRIVTKSGIYSIAVHVVVTSSSSFCAFSKWSAIVAEVAFSSSILASRCYGGVAGSLASRSAMRTLYSTSIVSTFSSSSLACPIITLTVYSMGTSGSMLHCGNSTQRSATTCFSVCSSTSFSASYADMVLHFD